MDETRITATLPNLQVQLAHRREEGAEVIGVQFRATPSFDAVEAMWLAPMQMWTQMAVAMWRPWLSLIGGPAAASICAPQITRRR